MRNIILILFFFLGFSVFAQNLVPNSGFETYTSCPSGNGEIYKATPWCQIVDSTNMIFNQLADYFRYCIPNDSIFGIPTFTLQYPNSGDGMAGFYMCNIFFSPFVKEHMQVPLKESLVQGTNYRLSLSVLYSDDTFQNAKSDLIAGPIQFAFSDSLVNYIYPGPYPSNLHSNKKVSLKDSLTNDSIIGANNDYTWHRMVANYIADGTETHLIIGNFDDDSTIITISDGPNPYYAFYYVDDVRIVEDTLTANNIVELENTYIKSKLLKIVDVLGRESKPKKNTPLFYIYDDGTVEKKIIINQ